MAYLLREGNTACNDPVESARAKVESKTGGEVYQRLDQSAEDEIRFRISRIPARIRSRLTSRADLNWKPESDHKKPFYLIT